jgi:hypothetical protein
MLEHLKVNMSLIKLEASKQGSVPPDILYNFNPEHGDVLMAHGFLSRYQRALTLLAHVDPETRVAVSVTFGRHNVSPQPERRPNRNETSNHYILLRSLRSPPPAANRNRASSTAQHSVCLLVAVSSYSSCPYSMIYFRCVIMWSGLLHSRS